MFVDYLQQQKDKIDEDARKAKEAADNLATEEKQTLADNEASRVLKVAEDEAKRIRYDAQK